MDDDNTEDIIEQLHPGIRMHARTMVAICREIGIPLIIISGTRSKEENDRVGGAPGSLHLHGLAFDVAVAGLPRDYVPAWFWRALGAWAETNLGLSWGGRFVHNGKPDVNHFDLRRIA